MAVYDTRRNEAFIRSEASGSRSRDVVTLKQSATVYESGTPLVREYVASDEEAPAVLDEATNKFVAAHGSGIEDFSKVEVAFLNLRTSAADGDVLATVIKRQAEIHGHETDLADLTEAERAAFDAAAEAATLIVR
jgi:hypothetical protein